MLPVDLGLLYGVSGCNLSVDFLSLVGQQAHMGMLLNLVFTNMKNV